MSIPTPDLSGYNDWDLERLKSLYDEIKEWLAEKLEAQKALSASQDPVLEKTELSARISQLQVLNSEILQRKLRSMPKSSSSKSKTKTSKSKSKKTKTSNATSDPTSGTEAAPTGSLDEETERIVDEIIKEAEKSASRRDEL